MNRAGESAFSLIEVVLALAVMSFALVAVVGLFSVGLQTNKESSDQLQATDVASLLISARRAQPTGTLSNFALPALNVAQVSSAATGVLLSLDGTVASSSATAPFRVAYTVGTNAVTGSKSALVYLLIWWPGSLANPPTNSPGAYYQTSTQVALP